LHPPHPASLVAAKVPPAGACWLGFFVGAVLTAIGGGQCVRGNPGCGQGPPGAVHSRV